MLNVVFFCYAILAFLHEAVSRTAIGPIAALRLTNVNMAPDGFNRSVIAAGGTVPGPLIKGNKVGELSRY